MEQKHVIMIASENGALRGGKVGGVADVIRDLPLALAELGWRVTTIIPSYGFLQNNNPSTPFADVMFPFQGRKQRGEFLLVNKEHESDPITHFLFDHELLRGDPIYYDDPPATPFMRDATKYALFCSAVGQFLQTMTTPYVLHLHDWHAATMLLLAELHPEFSALREVPTVFTIHNLSIQGTRPMQGHASSVQSWFPALFTSTGWISIWKDPRYPVPCYTPMAVGIRFADKVNTVSPTYAREILKPSDPVNGIFRGEGLEEILQNAATGKRLFGILNGCAYPQTEPEPRLPFNDLCTGMIEELRAERAREIDPQREAEVARITAKLEKMRAIGPAIVLTSVTRVVEQKVRLFFENGSDGLPVFDHLIRMLETRNGVFIMLGSGTEDYETQFQKYSRDHDRVLFLKGYNEHFSRMLYRSGDLFLMPSSFEPCGISQMVAMREGQPCLVHFVGGLCDTVADLQSGFGFNGGTLTEIADNFVSVLGKAFGIYFGDKELWKKIQSGAAAARFTWEKSARQYVDLLYTTGSVS